MTRSLLVIAALITQLSPSLAAAQCEEDLIFADSFETGTKPPWDDTKQANGTVSVSPGAALPGVTGNGILVAKLNEPGSANAKALVRDDIPRRHYNEARYRARFFFNPHLLNMAHATKHVIFGLRSATNVMIARVSLRKSFGNFQIQAAARQDDDGVDHNDDTWVGTAWNKISGWTEIELDWQASDNAANPNGHLELWLDGVAKDRIENIDNDLCRICKVDLGAVSNVDSSTTGDHEFDAFESRHCSYIGAP